MKSVLVGIKNIILWSHSRGTWQYDALCLLIVLAVFLVPSSYFGDRDRANEANNTGARSLTAAETHVEVEADALCEFLAGRHRTIDKLEPFTNPDGKVIYKVRLK
ncbi:MAG TPA: hypothetical protein VJ810_07840 [Blastocatellia bacterium]|nr:hypothetical protein [Blastocatellia bacterium]